MSGKKVGIFFGTFAPLHIGHQSEVYKASSLNDEVLIIASGYTGDRGDKVGLPLYKRFRYVREAFNDEKMIKVDYLNEDDIPKIPLGWEPWFSEVLKLVAKHYSKEENNEYTFYTGEEDYKDRLEKLIKTLGLKNFKVSLMERRILDISGNEIRSNVQKYWDYINRVYRRHFTYKISILGDRNTGKSTLVRRLARMSNSSFSEQYLNNYLKESNISRRELEEKDYYRIIAGQYESNSIEINSKSNNGITFFDTDNLINKVYLNMYLPNHDKVLSDYVDHIIETEKKDLILVIPDKNNKLDNEFYSELFRQIERFNLRKITKILDKNSLEKDDNKRYFARMNQATSLIQENTTFDIKKLHYK